MAKEVGFRYSSPELSVTGVLFHTYFENLIVINNSNADGTPDNAGNVVSKGLELSTRYEPEWLLDDTMGDISFYANYNFTNANLDGNAEASDSKASIFSGGMDGSNIPYIPEHKLSIGADYEIQKFDFGVNMTYQSKTYGTASETETEVHAGSPNARAGAIDEYFLVNLYAGYDITDNYSIKAAVNNVADLDYIATRHPAGARAGAPLTAYIRAIATF